MWLVILMFLFYSLSYYADTSYLGIYVGCPWYNYFIFSFIHIHLLHLATNCILLLFYWRTIKNMNKYTVVPIIILATILSSILSVYNEPTIGLSASVISMAGVITATQNRKGIIKIICIFALSCLTTILFAPHINTLIHVYSFIFSLTPSLILRRFLYDRN